MRQESEWRWCIDFIPVIPAKAGIQVGSYYQHSENRPLAVRRWSTRAVVFKTDTLLRRIIEPHAHQHGGDDHTFVVLKARP